MYEMLIAAAAILAAFLLRGSCGFDAACAGPEPSPLAPAFWPLVALYDGAGDEPIISIRANEVGVVRPNHVYATIERPYHRPTRRRRLQGGDHHARNLSAISIFLQRAQQHRPLPVVIVPIGFYDASSPGDGPAMSADRSWRTPGGGRLQRFLTPLFQNAWRQKGLQSAG